jgi:hypothetical protein
VKSCANLKACARQNVRLASTVSRQCKKTETNRQFATKKTEKEKRYNEQPTHKTAHLQAPTHKPMLQLAKEQFSCQRTAGY